jgi:hypothetical protein
MTSKDHRKQRKQNYQSFSEIPAKSHFIPTLIDLFPPFQCWNQIIGEEAAGSKLKKTTLFSLYLCRRRGITSASADTTRAESCAPPAAPCTTRNAGDPANISQVQHPQTRYFLRMPSQLSWVRSQNPPTQWNLRGGR